MIRYSYSLHRFLINSGSTDRERAHVRNLSRSNNIVAAVVIDIIIAFSRPASFSDQLYSVVECIYILLIT